MINLGLFFDRRLVKPLVTFDKFLLLRVLGADLCTLLANAGFEIVSFFIRLLLA